jgi:hypothetical protein
MTKHLSARAWIAPLLAVVFFAICILLTKTKPDSWNDISRVAAMESLVENGTWAIDASPWIDLTQDKVFLNGRFYSGKMPLLSWLGAGLYAGLRTVGGLSLAPDCDTAARGCAYYWITLILMGAPAALMIALFYDFARRMNLSLGVAALGTLALGVGTMVFPYSLVVNHHLPSAVSLFAAFYILTTRAARDPRWLLGTGFFASFAICCDPLSGIFAAAMFAVAVVRFRQRASYFVLGGLLPLLLTAWLDLHITGTILPPYLTPSGYNYEGATPGRGVAGAGTPDDLPQYAFKMFLGAQGLFAYNLILFFAVAGIVIVAATRGHTLRLEALAVGLGFVALALYLIFRTGNLGGVAYGERYIVHSIPLVMAFIFFAPPLAPRDRLAAHRIASFALAPFFVVALTLSIFSSYEGAQHPWVYTQPPVQLTRNATTGEIGWRWNLRFHLR